MRTNLNDLIPNFQTIDEMFNEQKVIYRKNIALYRFVKNIFPYGIEGTYSFNAISKDCIRCFIYLNQNEASTIKIIKWITGLKNKRLKVEKFWREESGYFSYRIQRNYKMTDYLIFIEATANIDGCKIVKRQKMHTVFETDCENGSTILI